MKRQILVGAIALTLSAGPAIAAPLPPDAPATPAPQPAVQPGTWAWGLLVPGLGHVLLGDPWAGVRVFVGAVIAPILGYTAGRALDTGFLYLLNGSHASGGGAPNIFDPNVPSLMTVPTTVVGSAVGVGAWAFSAWDAYQREQALLHHP